MYPQIFGKYVLEGEIASGGMAVVYRATLRGAGGFEKRLVVKQIRAELAGDPDFVQRFVDEAKTTVELGHPNIVPVYELGVEQGVYYIAMELAEGVTLAELLREAGALSPEEGAYVGAEVCRALDYAHRRGGIVHRDVTPRNVIIDEEGHVRLIDFGIAAPVRDDDPGQRIFGSPGHMPPEQIHGEPLTPAADVFAVGALLIEAWTREAPFRRSTREASERSLSEPLPDLAANVPALAELAGVVAEAVALDANARPQSAEELARPLRAFLRDVDTADVARRLGERVRAIRAVDRTDRPAGSATHTPGATPLTPTTAALVPRSGEVAITRTFAVRPQLIEWTGERPSAAHEEPRRPDRPPLGRRSVFVGLVVAFVALASGLAVLWAPRTEQTAHRAELPVAPRDVVRPPVASAAEVPTAVLPPDPRRRVSAPLAEVRSRPGEAGGPPARHAEPVASSDRAASEKAHAALTFTSDLPARVFVGRESIGVTPLGALHRPPGRYRVTFVSAELDEQVTTTIEVSAGQVLGVHAEFTRATPAVRLR